METQTSTPKGSTTKTPGSGRRPNSYYEKNGLPLPSSPEYLQRKGVMGNDWSTPDYRAMEIVEPLTLEDAPINIGRASNRETIELRNRIDKTILGQGVLVGKAFTLPKIRRHMVHKYLQTTYPELRFKVQVLGEFVRFVRVA